MRGNLDLPKSGALNAGLNLAEGLHDGRHNLLKANLLFVPQVQLAPHHNNWSLQLHHTNQTRQITMGQPKRQSNASDLDLHHEAPPRPIENRTWSRLSITECGGMPRALSAARRLGLPLALALGLCLGALHPLPLLALQLLPCLPQLKIHTQIPSLQFLKSSDLI